MKVGKVVIVLSICFYLSSLEVLQFFDLSLHLCYCLSKLKTVRFVFNNRDREIVNFAYARLLLQLVLELLSQVAHIREVVLHTDLDFFHVFLTPTYLGVDHLDHLVVG